MTRFITVLSASACLAGCSPQLSLLPALHGPSPTKPTPIQSTPVCPGSLMADPLPEPPLPRTAGFPAPTDPQASASVTQYLTWLHSYAIWGRQGWAIAKTARDFCLTAFLH